MKVNRVDGIRVLNLIMDLSIDSLPLPSEAKIRNWLARRAWGRVSRLRPTHLFGATYEMCCVSATS